LFVGDVVFDIIREVHMDDKFVFRELIESSAQAAMALSSKCNLQSCQVIFLTDEDLTEYVKNSKLESVTFHDQDQSVPKVNVLFQISEKPRPWTFKVGGELHEYTGGLVRSSIYHSPTSNQRV
jgi:hypothetical protein